MGLVPAHAMRPKYTNMTPPKKQSKAAGPSACEPFDKTQRTGIFAPAMSSTSPTPNELGRWFPAETWSIRISKMRVAPPKAPPANPIPIPATPFQSP